jgi:hypothetical protein
MRFTCAVALFLAVFGLRAALAGSEPLRQTFPAPDWRVAKSAGGFGADCVKPSCGRPAHVLYSVGPATPTVAERIKSGTLSREWAEQVADSYRRSHEDKITIINFMVFPGQVPSWSMVYECNCDGITSYISSRMVAGATSTMTFYSLARTPEAATANMNKLIVSVLGVGSR